MAGKMIEGGDDLGRRASAATSSARGRGAAVRGGSPAFSDRLDQLLRGASDKDPTPANTIVDEGMLAAARLELRQRRERKRVFGSTIADDPTWAVLLTLFLAGEEGRHMSVVELSSGVAGEERTLLRCVAHLAELGLIVRGHAAGGRAEASLLLSQRAKIRLCDYFSRTAADEGAAGA